MFKNTMKGTIFCITGLLASLNVFAGMNDDPYLTYLELDQLEVRDSGHSNLNWDVEGWLGKDLHKLWLKAEGERSSGKTEASELQLLYSRGIAAYWDLQVGVRHDIEPSPERSWAVIGFKGVAPYFIELDTALFVGESGQSAFRFDVEYELLFTQRLVLKPDVEVNFHGQNDSETGIGSGLSDIELGLRLHYELHRKFAPYIGVNWIKKYGNTADFAHDAGENSEDSEFVLGVRAWF